MTRVPKRDRSVTVWIITAIGGGSAVLVAGFFWAIASGQLHY
jgi:hypothetical protein